MVGTFAIFKICSWWSSIWVKWKVLHMISQEFTLVLSYYANLRDIDFTAEKATLFAVCGEYMTNSSTQSAFAETYSYWGRFSQVQSIFILWLSKRLLQVTGWLGELLQVGSHLPCRIHKKFTLAVPRVWGEIQMLRLTRARAVVLYRSKEVCDDSTEPFKPCPHPQIWKDAGEEFRPSCWHQHHIHLTQHLLKLHTGKR